MAAVEQQPQQQQQGQEQNQGRPPVTQLEFRQAMQDFKNMFPEMDEDVIEVVLRSNSGAVDTTIDQLLAMSTDNENERLRTELDATENDELPPCYSPSTPPPSYQQAVPYAHSSGPSLTLSTQAASTVATSSPSVSRIAISNLPPTMPQAQTLQPHAVITPVHLSVNEGSEELTPGIANEPLHNVRKWQPSLLGSLPQSFLRLDEMETFSRQTNSEQVGEGDWQHKNTRGAEDPELSQYLEDERIALFLQNEEFMQELRDNKEFLSALEKASSDVSSQDDDDDEPLESDAFSQAHKIPASEDTDAAFREKLRNMGKLSRKKFTQIARLFSRRKKRTFKPILGDGTNPSQDNLLLHEDEYSELSEEESEGELKKRNTVENLVKGAGHAPKPSDQNLNQD